MCIGASDHLTQRALLGNSKELYFEGSSLAEDVEFRKSNSKFGENMTVVTKLVPRLGTLSRTHTDSQGFNKKLGLLWRVG